MLKREGIAFGFLVLLVVAVGLKEPRFFQATSMESVLQWMPLILVAAMGQLLVILTGGIDLSIGAVLAFSGISVGTILKANPALPLPVAFAIGFGVGLLLGFVNGALIVWGRLPAIIVTIGTLAAFRGLTFLVSKGDQIDSNMLPDGLMDLSRTGIPLGPVTLSWLLILALLIALVTAAVLKFTRFGRNVIATGSNLEAAHLRGISTSRVQLAVYAICGALAGLAGVMYASRFGFVNPGSAGQSFELTVIAAVAIGGAKLTGGAGSVLGAMIGCILLACINVALSLLGIDANWQMLAYGVVILAGIAVDGLARRRA